MTDDASLSCLYSAASDEELREAARIGPDGYRPEAWRVIHEELTRRGLRTASGGRGAARRAAPDAPSARGRRRWTPGLVVGIVPAGAAAVGALRVMMHTGMARGVLIFTAVIFFCVWFGIALVIDWRRWWPGWRRSGRR